jgi:hypothetical protein
VGAGESKSNFSHKFTHKIEGRRFLKQYIEFEEIPEAFW